ncbi:MAG TPA: D-alanine--D-alanine ligase [Bacteroidales bacterium]|nr:MAG: D-alanine--D-alanine ligase A [Bacteroidetes bacterium GWF2_33_38]OFY76372.1 MAG: D-alanine--D-alanine ligase A [Bacteroidetes bacterium RIFOXYA12_FULL_33_9]HBF89422.1 D-alanine--D-alanine ligase [Bacteroidales bacterium]
MKKNIAILAGGDSSEYVISIQSAEQLEGIIDREKYNVYKIHVKGSKWNLSSNENINVDKNDFSIAVSNQKIKFDCALIAIHGTPGENGILQSYFDLIKVPYTTCSAFTSALTFNKFATKLFVKEYGVITAKSIIIRRNDVINSKEIVEKVGLPCFVKPNNGGSSFGTTKVKQVEDIKSAIELALKEDHEAIIEEFISGTEITNGVYSKSGEIKALPITEIVSTKEFFDYEAKYTPGVSNEITPARISPSLEKECKETSKKIYKVLNCKGVVRIDYIIHDEKLYFLEINTVPGMSKNSIVPQQVRADGLNLTDFFTNIIESSL